MHGIGDVIHDFRVVSILGKGGMGVVYKCEDLKLSRYVALKELGSSLSNDSDFVRRFRQEAHIQAQLSHSNITTLYSYFEENGHYYMALEFAKGKTLKALIKETGPIPEQRTLKIINNVLDALQYAHSHGVIHRDVKPANIIIDDDDNVKVLDFGIAKMAGERGMTQTGQRIGTVSYMSPEQIRTPQDIDIRSDIFSLGVTMFEMLSGRLPYNTDTDSDFEIMNQIVQSALPDPRSYYPQISENTVMILNKMLEKDRNARYSVILDVLRDLEHTPLGYKVLGTGLANDAFSEDNKADSRKRTIEVFVRDIAFRARPVRPWARFFARLLDLFIFSYPVNSILSILIPEFNNSALVLIRLSLIMCAYMIYEAALFMLFGSTPMKALLKIKVLRNDGGRLSFREALHRVFRTTTSGMCFGLPVVSLLFLWDSYIGLSDDSITSWDKKGEITVYHGNVGILRSFIAISMYLVSIYVISLQRI